MRPSPAELQAAYHIIERERFWSKVSLEGPLHPALKTRCWLWLGAHQQGSEYGVFRFRGTNTPAGKVALILSGVEVLDGLLMCHHCDNPSCIRPDHLFQGTDKENAEDMVAKGRSSHGEKHYRALLTEDDVKSIISRHLAGEAANALACAFNTSDSTISAILLGRQWRHLTHGQVHSRGRGRGEDAHAAKLTEEQVRGLRAQAATGDLGNISQLARELGVQRHTIYNILNGRTWANTK